MSTQKQLNQINPLVENAEEYLGKAASVAGDVSQFTDKALSGGLKVSASIKASLDAGAFSGFIAAGGNFSPPVPGDIKETVDKCLSDLSSVLGDIKTIGMTDADLSMFLSARLTIPFNDLGQQMAMIFKPKEKDFQNKQQIFKLVEQYASQVIASFTDPKARLTGMQTGSLANATDTVQKILFSGSKNLASGDLELANQLFDQTKLSMRALFVTGETNDNNLAGLFLYAIEETMPLIDEELDSLRDMKDLIRDLIESSSQLPPAFIPEIPNLAIMGKLDEAETELQTVLFELRQYQTFNRMAYGNATSDVCSAQEISRRGGVPSQYYKVLRDRFGLTDLQVSALANVSFLPDPEYAAKLLELQEMHEQVQSLNAEVLSLDEHLRETTEVLTSVEQTGIGGILSLIIEVFRGQIAIIKANLEAQVNSFVQQIAANSALQNPAEVLEVDGSIPFQMSGEQLLKTLQNRRSTGGSMGGFSAPIDHVVLYSQLSALCYMMGRARALIDNMTRLIEAQSAVAKSVLGMVGRYDVDCGPEDGADYIAQELDHFVSVVNQRLSGAKTTNEVVCSAGQNLISRIQAHEAFLRCMKANLKSGHSDIANTMANKTGGTPGSGGSMAGAKNLIMGTIRALPDMKKAMKSLDLRAILGTNKTEFSGLDKLMNGMKCIMQLCANPSTREAVQQVKARFDIAFSNRKSVGTTMGSFDETPKRALHVAITQRVTAINKSMESLKTLISSNLSEICLNSQQTANKIAKSLHSFEVGTIKIEIPPSYQEQASKAAADLKIAASAAAPFKKA